jgi:hypothetical protein
MKLDRAAPVHVIVMRAPHTSRAVVARPPPRSPAYCGLVSQSNQRSIAV